MFWPLGPTLFKKLLSLLSTPWLTLPIIVFWLGRLTSTGVRFSVGYSAIDSWELEPVIIFFYARLFISAFVTSTSFSGVDVCGASVSPGGLFVNSSLPERGSLAVDDLRTELECCTRPSPTSAPATGDTVLLSPSRLLFLLFWTDLKVFGGWPPWGDWPPSLDTARGSRFFRDAAV